jgi:hypothetical protein
MQRTFRIDPRIILQIPFYPVVRLLWLRSKVAM